MVACAGRIFMPLMSSGTTIFLVVRMPGAADRGRRRSSTCTSFISFAAYLRYQSSIARMPPLASAEQERHLARGDDREAARLIAGIDVGEVGDAVARHVVMVERLAELLRRKDLVGDGAVRGFLDVGAPVLDCLLQRMRRRHPVRQLQFDFLVVGFVSCAGTVAIPNINARTAAPQNPSRRILSIVSSAFID